MKKLITLTLVLTLALTSVFATQALAVQKKKSAKKVKAKTVTCTINLNGGKYGKTSKNLILRSRGGEFSLVLKNLKAKKRGNSFKGLYTKKKGGKCISTYYSWSDLRYRFTLKKNTTLYAHWGKQTFGEAGERAVAEIVYSGKKLFKK